VRAEGDAATPDDVYQVGVSRVDITPDYPVRMNGFGFRRDEAEGVTQRIWAKGLAVSHGDEPPVVVVTLDNLGVRLPMVEEVAAKLADKFKLPRERFAVTFTHTHTAPKVNGASDTIFSSPIPADQQAHIDQYTRDLTHWIEQAAEQALADRQPARLRRGVGTVGFAKNRRTEGGPVDHDLPVLVVEDLDGKVRAIYVSYACHCVTLSNNKISGDWAGFAQSLIEKNHPGAVALTSVGCGSDSNPSSGVTGDRVDAAIDQGQTIADEVERLLKTELTPVRGPIVATLARIDLPLAERPTREQLAATVAANNAGSYNASVQLARLDRGEPLLAAIDYPVQTWTFGDNLAMVFLAGEVCVDYSHRLKKELDASRLWLNGYSNDFGCYIPSERLLKEGGYGGGGEVNYFDLPATLAPGMEQLIIDEVRRQVPPKFNAGGGVQGVAPQSPQSSRDAMRTHDGLEVELVAAEPLVADPVAIDFAPDGSLLVAEMPDYSRMVDDEFKPLGRVRRLIDRDGDGVFDESTVVCEGLRFPTDVKAWRDGVLVCDAPDVLYFTDADGDGRCEQRAAVLTGFATHNPHARVNSLRWSVDNWLYGSGGLFGGTITTAKGEQVALGTSDFRFRPDEGVLEPASGKTQQGRATSDWGDWFGCDNSTLLWHYPLAVHYINRNPSLAPPAMQLYVPQRPNNRRLFPIGELVRFALSGAPGQPTSACGLEIYRDRLLGDDYYGNSFTCEPVNQLVHRLQLEPQSITFAGHRAESEQESEFLASTDKWFRPVQVRTGPDGALWVVDMYRYVIEHAQWIPEETRRELDLFAGSSRGRIYRIRPQGQPLRKVADLTKLDAPALAAAMDTDNGPTRDLVQQELLWRNDPAAAAPLEEVAKSSKIAAARMQALATLDGLGKLTAPRIAAALADPHPGIRRHAVRLAESRWSEHAELLAAALALVDDADPFVRQQLAYSLGAARDPAATAALVRLAAEHRGDANLQAAVLSSIGAENVDAVADLVFGAPVEKFGADFTFQLARTAIRLGGAERAARHLAAIVGDDSATADSSEKIAAAAQFLEAAQEQREALIAALDPAAAKSLAALLAAAEQVAVDEAAAVAARTAAVQLLARAGADPERLIKLLAPLVGPTSPPEVQTAVLDAWALAAGADAAAPILDAWPALTTALRGHALDVLISRPDRLETLLAKLQAGAVKPAEIDQQRRELLINHPDPRLRGIAAEVFAAGSAGSRGEIVERYRPCLSLTGDAERGREIFGKHCAACHLFAGLGKPVGPDLASTTARSGQALVEAIFDPNREVDQRYQSYIAVVGGLARSGILKSETQASLTLVGQNGETHTLLRSDLEEFQASPASFMPEGFEKEIDEQAAADLIQFLLATPAK
jgi:putative membrane-bound dehydrogenase-like protein